MPNSTTLVSNGLLYNLLKNFIYNGGKDCNYCEYKEGCDGGEAECIGKHIEGLKAEGE